MESLHLRDMPLKIHPKGEFGPESIRPQSIASMPTDSIQRRTIKAQSFRD